MRLHHWWHFADQASGKLETAGAGARPQERQWHQLHGQAGTWIGYRVMEWFGLQESLKTIWFLPGTLFTGPGCSNSHLDISRDKTSTTLGYKWSIAIAADPKGHSVGFGGDSYSKSTGKQRCFVWIEGRICPNLKETGALGGAQSTTDPSLSISWFAVTKTVGHSLLYILQTTFFCGGYLVQGKFFVIMAISNFYWQQ